MNASTSTIYGNFPQLSADLDAFLYYTACCRRKVAGDEYSINLKEEHSLRVLTLAGEIAQDFKTSQDLRKAVLLSALYHDFGRFDQYLKYRSFLDQRSKDHGLMGLKALKSRNLPLEAAPAFKPIIQAAVGMHNRRNIPTNLPAELDFIVKIVRDADKIDIIALLDRHFRRPQGSDPVVTLHLKDQPDRFSPEILELILKGGAPAYTDLRLVNDFKMLFVAWLAQLNFSGSKKLLLAHGHLQNIVSTLPDAARSPLAAMIKM